MSPSPLSFQTATIFLIFDSPAVAIGAMTTAGESKIKKIVAVWKDKGDGDIYVVSPCGRCREFIARIDASNLETEVILAENKSATLKELLPYYDSYTKV